MNGAVSIIENINTYKIVEDKSSLVIKETFIMFRARYKNNKVTITTTVGPIVTTELYMPPATALAIPSLRYIFLSSNPIPAILFHLFFLGGSSAARVMFNQAHIPLILGIALAAFQMPFQ